MGLAERALRRQQHKQAAIALAERSSRHKKAPSDYLPSPQPGGQQRCVGNPADIIFYGGAAGAGKSFMMLWLMARHLNQPGYGAVIFRKTAPEITNEGGLWAESLKLYQKIPGGRPRGGTELDWIWREWNTRISFRHADGLFQKWPGAQICGLGFDEVTTFDEEEFWFLQTRNRSTCGVSPFVFATCNPDADSWVADTIAWWIDQHTGYAIPERSGVVRFFYRFEREKQIYFHWGSTAEELIQSHPDLAYPKGPDGPLVPPKSLTFIRGTLEDNKVLLSINPGYMSNLYSQDLVTRERLMEGNWKIKYAAGLLFRREWLPKITKDQFPEPWYHLAEMRFWDMAATAKERNALACYTSGVKIKVMIRRESDPERDTRGVLMFVVTHVYAEQIDASEVLDVIAETAREDGVECLVRWEEEGGSAGPIVETKLASLLTGYDAMGIKPQGDKLTRALPLSRAAKGRARAGGNGCVYILDDGTGGSLTKPGAWNEQYIRWMENFDGLPANPKKGKINDVVDASSGCYLELAAIAGTEWLMDAQESREDFGTV